MKITFDNWNPNQNVEKSTSTQGTFSQHREIRNGAYALDISGDVMDNNAYAGHGRSAKEVMQEFGAELDNLTAKQNQMTVMSNIMSTEDFNKMMEEGFDPTKLDPEQVVTIVDHIKAQMAKSGEVVAGYNDDLSREKLTNIFGSSSLAKEVEDSFAKADLPVNEETVYSVKDALDKAAMAGEPDDAGKKYMLENHLEPTVENIYRASFSAQGDGSKQSRGYFSQELPGYYAKKADIADLAAMEPQIEKTLEKMDLGKQSREESVEQAKWLISRGIPVTEQTMQGLREINSISFPLEQKDVITAATHALVKGIPAADGHLVDDKESVYEKAGHYLAKAQGITTEAVMETVARDEEVTLKNLGEVQRQINAKEIYVQEGMSSPDREVSVKYVQAARTLAEVQLRMTIDANIRLLKSNYAIDTVPLTELVEALKKQEEKLEVSFFGKENPEEIGEKTALYKQTDNVLKEIPYLPAAVIGRIKATREATLTSIHTQGTALREQYRAAGLSYEMLMTAPRADMGDSIRKAFANVDDILQDMGQELSQENRKAVRILGYNNTPITEESVAKVREAYVQVETVVKAMTPARTISMIREGMNPLTMSLNELETYLDNLDDTPQAKADSYARFLFELEKNGQVSESERSAYIGIYRTFHQIEKADGAAIGSLLNQGGEFTLGNLLTAARNRKAGRMEYTIDDNFGLLTGVSAKGKSITEQVEEGIARTAQARMDEAKQMWNAAATADKATYELLQNAALAISAENVVTAQELYSDKGNTVRRIKEYAKGTDEKGNELIRTLVDKFNDYESAQLAMEEWEGYAKDVLSEMTDSEAETFEDMRAVTMCYKQLALTGSLRKQENYEIPMEINGEITSVNLVLVHNAKQKGTVNITLQTKEFGKAGVRFRISGNMLESYFIADSEMGKERLQEVGESCLRKLSERGFDIGETNYVNAYSRERKDLNLLTFSQSDVDNNNKTVATKQLYEVAKVFLTGLQEV